MNLSYLMRVARCLADHKVIRTTPLLLLIGPAAAQLVIGPTAVEFGSKQRVSTVTVTLDSKAKAPMRLQAEVHRWQQNLAGDAVTEETTELLVTPPITELRPGQRQIFRLALRGQRPAPEELAYRLILEDISGSTGSAQLAPDVAINFRMRYDLPVVIAPAGPIVNQLRWKPCLHATSASGSKSGSSPLTSSSPSACVRMLNAGNRRVKVQTLTISGDGWQQAMPFKEGVNVLAGAEREWHVPLQPDQTGALRGIHVHTARGEDLQAEAGF